MNRYLFDADLLAHLAVQQNLPLLEQHIPPQDRFPVQHGRVLDVMSGAGMWALHMAKSSPNLQVVGIEARSHLMVYARAQCWATDCPNLSFLEIENGQGLQSIFAEASFDFVHAAFQMERLAWCDWPGFVRQVVALTKPDGYFRFIEFDGWLECQAPALGCLLAAFRRALWLLGRCATPHGELGLLSQVRSLLEDDGLEAQVVRMVLDCSFGSLSHGRAVQHLLVFLASLQSLLFAFDMSEETFHRLYEEVLREVQQPSFQFFWHCGYVLGRGKRRSGGHQPLASTTASFLSERG